MKSTDASVRRDSNCVWRVIGDNALIVKIKTADDNSVFTLNKTGTAIWQSMDGGKTEDEIVAHVRASFLCPEGTDIVADVQEFTGRLMSDGLLETKSTPTSKEKKDSSKRGDLR